MSHQKTIEESPRLFPETIQIHENDSLLTIELSDSEDTAAEGFAQLPCFSSGSESDDDTVSTPEAVDTNNQVIPVKLSRPRVEVANPIRIDLPRSTCGRSDSETSSSFTGDSSEVYSFLQEPEGFFARCYERTWILLLKLRDKGYLLPFELICLGLTITSCYMGAYYWPMCPADVYIPRYVFFNGAIATFSVCVEIMDSLWKLFLRQENGVRVYFCAFGIGWIALTTTLIEMIQFYTMSYSFQKSEENYCNETFYLFVFYKNIAFGVLMFLTALIYIPTFDFYYFVRVYV